MNRSRAGHYAISSFLLAATVAYLFSALSIEGSQGGGEGEVGSAALPVAASVVMILAALILAIQTFTGKNDSLPEEDPQRGDIAPVRTQRQTDGVGWRKKWLRSPLTFMIAVAVYALLVSFVGFFVPTAVFMLVTFTLLGILSWWARFLVTIGFLLFAYLLFVRVLLVSLPAGPWGF